jgi:hypothetical protein
MSAELAVIDQPQAPVDLVPANLFGTADPDAVVAKAAKQAGALAKVVRDKNLSVQIRQSTHVRVEGWTLLGSMLGVFPVCVSTEPVEVEGAKGYKATVEARTLAGAVVGRAEALCLRSETRWRSADEYAVLSMAQTRATSKALRNPLGFIMALAGYNPTPAEEMPQDGRSQFVAPALPPDEPKKADRKGTISDAQRKRLWAIAHEHKVENDDVKHLVQAIAGVESTNDIPKDKYEALIEALERDIPFD